MKAEIIAIGSELLTPFRLDTNSLFLTKTLEEHGIPLIAKSVVGDDLNQLVHAYQTAFERSDLIICSGGLGPTVDDLTKEALCEFLKIPLVLDSESWERIQERFRKFGWKMPESNRKQAMVPAGSKILQNDNGSAPGVYVEASGRHFFLLPGPPVELEPMWRNYALPLIPSQGAFERKIFRIAMMPESQVDELLKPVSSSLKDVRYTILAVPSEIEVHLLAPQSALDELISASAEVRAIMGDRIYTDDLRTLEEVVGSLLKKASKTVSVAESCSGGLLAERFTNIPGSSAYFERGVIAYSNRTKVEVLHVPASVIESYGAVSEPAAAAMADGIRKTAGTDFGLSITGVAGPDGGSAEKPVGTVFVGLAAEDETIVKKYGFPGSRNRVRFSSTHAALNLLRLKLLK